MLRSGKDSVECDGLLLPVVRQLVFVHARYPILVRPIKGALDAPIFGLVDKAGINIAQSTISASDYNQFDTISPGTRDTYVVVREWKKCDGETAFTSFNSNRSISWHLNSYGITAGGN